MSVDIEFVISRFREDLTPLVELLCDPATLRGASFRLTVYDKGGQDTPPVPSPAPATALEDESSGHAESAPEPAPAPAPVPAPDCAVRHELTAACERKARQVAHTGSAAAKQALRRFSQLALDRDRLRVYPLQNLGREADTYLHHLCEQYDCLAAVTLLLPASCMNEVKSEHTRQLVERAVGTRSSVLAGQWIVPTVRGRLGPFMIKKWQGLDSKNASHLPTVAVLPSTRRPYSVWYDHYFPDTTVNVVCYYSMLAVAAAHVQQHPVQRYRDLLAEVRVHSNPETGHYMERSWAAVFHPIPDACVFSARPNNNAASSGSGRGSGTTADSGAGTSASANTSASGGAKSALAAQTHSALLQSNSLSQLLSMYKGQGRGNIQGKGKGKGGDSAGTKRGRAGQREGAAGGGGSGDQPAKRQA